MKPVESLLCAVAIGASCPLACQSRPAAPIFDPGPSAITATPVELDLGGPLRAIPPMARLDARRVALGRRLFQDPRLSGDGSVACASCHPLDRAGVDGRPRAIGIHNQVGSFNTPTVFNAALNFRQFWDGRAETLEEQAGGPIENPRELGSSYDALIGKVNADPSYVRQIAEAYDGQVASAALLSSAIATFERSLVLPGSRFDRFLAGVEGSIDPEERQGYELFTSYGCSSCHQGANVGGNMFERFGIARDYLEEREHQTTADLGRFHVTGRKEDRYVFRVPSLRLVTMTAPYLHDGSVQSLDQMIRLMARYQLGRELVDGDVRLIERFLDTLAGSYDGATFAQAP